MIDTLNIGSYIYSTLSGLKYYKSIPSSNPTGPLHTQARPISVKVYPLVADNDAKFPFVVYKRTNLSSNGCKDGYYQDTAIIQVVVVHDNYATGVSIANDVRTLLEKQYDTFDDWKISNCHLIAANEEYSNNAYIQTMQFQLEINK